MRNQNSLGSWQGIFECWKVSVLFGIWVIILGSTILGWLLFSNIGYVSITSSRSMGLRLVLFLIKSF